MSHKSQKQNPNGLHARFVVKKLVINDKGRIVQKAIPKDYDYFVLRLDLNGKDFDHIRACRIAINAYADMIEYSLPQLAKEIREKYPTV